MQAQAEIEEFRFVKARFPQSTDTVHWDQLLRGSSVESQKLLCANGRHVSL